MAQDKLPFIFAKMQSEGKFSSVRKFRPKSTLPPRNVKEHRKYLLDQLVDVEKKVKAKSKDKLEDAKGIIVAVTRKEGTEIKISSLGDKKHGVRVLYDVPEALTTVVDVSQGDLSALKKKIFEYGENPKVSKRSKSKEPKPSNNGLVAPIETILPIGKKFFSLVWGPRLQAVAETLTSDEVRPLEVSLRGGRYLPEEETNNSRKLLSQALNFLELPSNSIPEFIATEKLVVLLEINLYTAQKIFEMTGAVTEIELASQVTLNWKLIEYPETFSDIPKLLAPPENAPSVVILDTGVNSVHPTLEKAIAVKDSVLAAHNTHNDLHGHGTCMAGLALHGESLAVLLQGRTDIQCQHWIDSIKLFAGVNAPPSSRENAGFWPVLTKAAVTKAEENTLKTKAYVMAVTAPNVEPGSATSWSLAIDELAYNEGRGRLFFVSIGNCDGDTYTPVVNNFPDELHLSKLKDPAQSFNCLTIGAFTNKDTLPSDGSYNDYAPLAKRGEISPHTSSGLVSKSAYKVPIKPDVVFEGGNIAVDRTKFVDDKIPTLTSVTTGHNHLQTPYQVMFGTSSATALAGHLSMQIWKENPALWPETVRGLIVHSASWTPEMLRLIRGRDDRIALCGYGVPSLDLASFCTRDRATIIVQDTISNLVKVDSKEERRLKTFRLPVPQDTLLANPDTRVGLRVTLSYFAEPNSAKGIPNRGMDLLWDIQGPTESDENFLKRINNAMRDEDEKSPGTKSFDWEIGILKRRRGTVQSDRWSGTAADLAGAKLIAVFPKAGWWSERKALKFNETRFSLIISVITPGIEVYNEISNSISVSTTNILVDA